MKVKFIAQGFDIDKSKPAGEEINTALKSSSYDIFAAFVAFVSVDGINQLKDNMIAFTQSGGTIKLFVSVDMHGTSKEALELLLTLPVKSYVVHSPNKIVYHPKIYSFEGKEQNMVLIGSFNLTLSGLYQNMEASLCVFGQNDNEEDRSLLSDIYDYYNALLMEKSTSCQPLTKELIELLARNKVVLPSLEIRKQNNSLNKENQVSSEYLQELNTQFKKLKIAKPKVIKKGVIENIYTEKKQSAPSVYSKATEIKGKSMWIETRKMTGGSRNILDLSKHGKQGKRI